MLSKFRKVFTQMLHNSRIIPLNLIKYILCNGYDKMYLSNGLILKSLYCLHCSILYNSLQKYLLSETLYNIFSTSVYQVLFHFLSIFQVTILERITY